MNIVADGYHLDVSLSTDSGDWTAWSEWGPCSGDCEQDGVRNYRYKARDCISSSYHVAHSVNKYKSYLPGQGSVLQISPDFLEPVQCATWYDEDIQSLALYL
jgi:hypothetical protein